MRQKRKILFTTFEGSENDQLLPSIERTPEERLAFLKRLQQIKLDASQKYYDIEDNRKRLSLKRKERKNMGDNFYKSFIRIMVDFFSQYQADQRRGQIFTTFSALTILIACLGLLGLALYTTEQRTKEIGIRKVIGASVANVVMLLYKDFFMLVAIAIVLAFPVAYYFMHSWLQTFAYQTDIEVLTFVLSALLTLLITLLAVGFHTVKAATANPVKALQSE